MHSTSKHPFLVLLISICFYLSATAQEKGQMPIISGNFENASIEEVLSSLDAFGIDVFYKSEDIPSKQITESYSDVPLDEFLTSILNQTAAGYFLYRNTEVVIVPRQLVDDVYSVKYYQALEGSGEDESNSVFQEEISSIGSIENLSPTGRVRIVGTVKDEQTDEAIIGATVVWQESGTSTITDVNGVFETTIEAGTQTLEIKYLGYVDMVKKFDAQSDGDLNLSLFKEAITIDEVTITGRAVDESVESAQIGVTTIDVKTIKKLPTFLGEADVIKSILLNPGVSSIGEGATGFNVRGGEVDQNLVMQDEAFLFNSSHALGFYSTFNADLINKVDLFKGNIPAQYGGRLASVMDVEMRNGNFEEFDIKGGVGPVASRLSIEGPIAKGKTAFLIGGRASYTDWILDRINEIEVRNSSALFYDINGRITHRFSQKNNLTLSGYFSQDDFTYNNEFGFDYSTILGEATFRSIFNDNFYSKFSAVYSEYKSTQFDLDGLDASDLAIDISYIKIKEMLTLETDNEMKFEFGGQGILYNTMPGSLQPADASSLVTARELAEEKGLEAAIFANLEWELTPSLLVTGGIRYSLFQFRGPSEVYQYVDPEAPTNAGILGTELQDGAIATYSTPEPRISARLKVSENASVKAGYSRTSQYFNQIFNSDSPTPTSQWQLSNTYIRPNLSNNYSTGIFKNFDDNNWETSVEVYYRDIDRLFDFRDFAELVANDHIETELLSGIGQAYGAELSIKKKKGTFNGWLSYTYARSQRQVEGINNGEWYSSNFDKPHDVSLILNYNPNQRHTISVNFNYATGRPTTPPIGNFETSSGLVVPVFSQRNQVRIPDYHRLDIAYTIGRGYKKNAKFKTSWTLSIYNVYGRRNAFSVFFTQGAFNRPQANRLAILGAAFPSLTFNFEFL